MSNQNNPLVRFIGKLKSQVFNRKNPQPGEDPTFQKFTILMDNPYANNKDGTPNQYYKGHLCWFDVATNQHYLVKQVELSNVGQDAKNNGFINSLKLNLGDEYHVQKLG